MKRKAMCTLLVVVSCLALIAGLQYVRPPLRTYAASSESHRSVINSSHITCGQWNHIPSPSQNAGLFGVAAIAVTDTWAVGFMNNTSNPNNHQTFTMHWNGMHWRTIPSPNLTGSWSELRSVATLSTNDVWAVGDGTSLGGNGYEQALIEHWDGTSWSIVPSPSIGISNTFYSVSSIPGTNELWAVGNYAENNSNYPLIEYWDGTQWTVVSTPSVNSNNSSLQSVTALSATDAWAVGWFTNAGVEQTLTEHWDGTSWSIVPSPNSPSSSDGILLSVTPVPNTGELWAVGDYNGTKFNQTLVEHWDGSAWSIVASANAGGSNLLLGTLATAPNSVWSIGFYGKSSGKALMEHWDGVQWSVVAQPASAIANSSLWGLSQVPQQTLVWAVGHFYSTTTKMYHPLTLLYC